MGIYVHYFQSPYGELIIGDYRGRLCLCDWRYRKMRQTIDRRLRTGLQCDYIIGQTDLTRLTMEQLNEYFQGQRKVFDVPLLLVGTDFQKSVWQELIKIPYGRTESYMSLAVKLGNPTAVRAVAAANGANAISIIIPCHRIVGSHGELVGYAGGLRAKSRLLELENADGYASQLKLF